MFRRASIGSTRRLRPPFLQLEVRSGNDPSRRWAAVGGGFADVNAEQQLEHQKAARDEEFDFRVEEAALQRAVIRIQVSEKKGIAA